MGDYVKVCETSDLSPGSMRGVDVSGKRLMIVNVNGRLYALDRTCTHEDADLSTGFLVGSTITCPLHLSRFDAASGEVQNPPATASLKTYELKIEGTSVYVQV